jgi:hypothetical protein
MGYRYSFWVENDSGAIQKSVVCRTEPGQGLFISFYLLLGVLYYQKAGNFAEYARNEHDIWELHMQCDAMYGPWSVEEGMNETERQNNFTTLKICIRSLR